MSHSQFGVQFHQEPVAAFSIERALFTIEEHNGCWSGRGWIEAYVLLAEIGPHLYVLLVTPLTSAASPSQTTSPLVRCSLWECSGSGYDEDSHRIWVSPTWDSRIMFSIAEDIEYWAFVRLIFESRDAGRRRREELERLSLRAATLLPGAVEGSNANENHENDVGRGEGDSDM